MLTNVTADRIRALAEQANRLAQQGNQAASRSVWEQLLALSPEHALGLNYLGQEALLRGDFGIARDLLQRAITNEPSFALAHANLARAKRHLGDSVGALTALDSALKLEPQAFPAHLEKAFIFEELGQERNAALAYERALRLVPGQAALPAVLQTQLAHAQRIVAENKNQLSRFLDERLSEVRPKQDNRGMSRFDESLQIAKGQKPFYQPRPLMFPITGLPNIAFFDRQDFAWAASVEAASHDVRRELAEVIVEDATGFVPYVQTADGEPVGQFASLDRKLDWGAYFLWQHGLPVPEHAARCPKSMAALAHAPQAEVSNRAPAAFFSALKPHTHIPPHNGATNCRLTVHLPLIIPEHCAIRVGNHVRPWTPGELLIFDDTMEHEAWNRSDHLRVVLIFDIWHPLLSEVEKIMVKTALEGMIAYYGESASLGEL